ncbi:hypothetical protein PoB_005902000 [Plakobranchus ocellatus]|uniref:Polycystin cation channel PKD1/PKD2 domain-containing protein n=1 Tax=Plakobranchus ocellatus TaxID=259542 RepID=A0AAV4CI44_9GAST|nr:hypothetical protein PoB_005902000 [Plakobranchus ocellatus]
MQHSSHLEVFRDDTFIVFTDLGVFDRVVKAACGILMFTCIFQLLYMLSKIRRLLVFIRLLGSAMYLFFMPLIWGISFTLLSYIWFGPTNENFATLKTSYLMVNQYFVKPRPMYDTLNENTPIQGKIFVYAIGFLATFFVTKFFIAILNEAYTIIKKQIRFSYYKVRQQSKFEYLCEFLGLQSTAVWDSEEDRMLLENANDRAFIAHIKSLQGN